MSARVFMSLGTDLHPFDRAVSLAEASSQRLPDTSWFVQYGSSRWAADMALAGAPMLSIAELGEQLDAADVVVCHGGPGLIMEARAVGHLPLVIPRDPQRGEHVDGHQMRFAAALAADGLVRLCASTEELVEAVADTLRRGRSTQQTDAGLPAATLVAFADALVDATSRNPHPLTRILRRQKARP